MILCTMAEDLGVSKYLNESEIQYAARTLYSALACWIKAVALEQPITSIDQVNIGVSRRHITDKCTRILEEMLKRNPELKTWFHMISKEDNPIALIRRRLIHTGDLLNVGFDTNVTLSDKKIVCLSDNVKWLKGEILIADAQYSGISVLNYTANRIDCAETIIDDSVTWFSEYLKRAWWKCDVLPDDGIQYFDAYKKAQNNYLCWQAVFPKLIDGVVLARRSVNKYGYEYFFIKQQEGILIHRIDPFLQKIGEHRRFMIVLRCLAHNNIPANVTMYQVHIHVKLHAHLPQTEKYLLESYAWPFNRIDDELEWDMPEYVWQYISRYFRKLGLALREDTGG